MSLTNLVRDEIVPADALPIRLTAHTPCFRSEAGAYGKDTRGMIRQHQFDKVEMVQITRPERSYEALDEMVGHAEAILQALQLPYRVVAALHRRHGLLRGEDLRSRSVAARDRMRYREISSVSNCESFQARRMQARFRMPGRGSRNWCIPSTGPVLPSGARWSRYWRTTSRPMDRSSFRRRCAVTWAASRC